MKDKDCGRDTETGYKEAFRFWYNSSLKFKILKVIMRDNLILIWKGRSVGTRKGVSLPMKSSNLKIFHICLFIFLFKIMSVFVLVSNYSRLWKKWLSCDLQGLCWCICRERLLIRWKNMENMDRKITLRWNKIWHTTAHQNTTLQLQS